MTRPRKPFDCPLCHYGYKYLGKHLINMHHMKNQQERKIVLQHASGRINIRKLPCPVEGCEYRQSRLDKHLYQAHVEMPVEDIDQLVRCLKLQITIQKLRDLRATDPTPPMMSYLDLDEAEAAMRDVPMPGDDDDPAAGPTCVSCQELESKNRKLAGDLRYVRLKLRSQIRMYKRAKKTISNLEKVCILNILL